MFFFLSARLYCFDFATNYATASSSPNDNNNYNYDDNDDNYNDSNNNNNRMDNYSMDYNCSIFKYIHCH
uniref:Secreted protein n=1 Tax=Caenorhabditis tropicalis TaxID=1561998 RepID=A0A1I7T8I4_9PELO